MPRPLRYVGLHTVVQATLHLPLVPAQMKARHRGEARDLLPAPASSHRRVGGDTPPVAGKLPRRSKPSAAVAAHWRAAAAARGGAQQGCCLQSPAPSTLFPFPPSELALSMVVGGRCGRNGQIHALHGRIRVLPTWIRAQGAGAVEASRAWWPAAAAAGQPPLWLFQGAARGGVSWWRRCSGRRPLALGLDGRRVTTRLLRHVRLNLPRQLRFPSNDTSGTGADAAPTGADPVLNHWRERHLQQRRSSSPSSSAGWGLWLARRAVLASSRGRLGPGVWLVMVRAFH